MPHLIDLPAELLIQIFAASDAIPDALHLSATNRLLNAVWLEHSKPIIESILKPTLPAYDEAVQLAYTEVQLESTESSIDSSPSFRGCLPTLLRNADLCASVCLAYSPVCKDATLAAVSCYFLRRIGLGFIHYQLRDDIYLELRSMSTEELMHRHNLSDWLDRLVVAGRKRSGKVSGKSGNTMRLTYWATGRLLETMLSMSFGGRSNILGRAPIIY